MKKYFSFDNFIKFILVGLLLNILTILICITWGVQPGIIQHQIFSNYTFFWIYFITIGICFLWLLKENIVRISLSIKDGFKAELKQIQREKEEIVALKDEIRELALDTLESQVTIIENARRWVGWSDSRYHASMEKIQEKCDHLKCKKEEHDKIFQTKSYWDKINQIGIVKDQIIQLTPDQNQRNLIDAEWNAYIREQQQPSSEWLIKFLDSATAETNQRNKLLTSIRNLK